MSDEIIRRLERELESEGRDPKAYARAILGSSPAWVTDRWPPERRMVLVHIRAHGTNPAAVAVGYCRHHSGGPFWVIPGVGVGGGVEAWADLLGDEFTRPPLWGGGPENLGRGLSAAEGGCQGFPQGYREPDPSDVQLRILRDGDAFFVDGRAIDPDRVRLYRRSTRQGASMPPGSPFDPGAPHA